MKFPVHAEGTKIAFTRVIKLYGDFGTLFCYPETIPYRKGNGINFVELPLQLASQFRRKLKGKVPFLNRLRFTFEVEG